MRQAKRLPDVEPKAGKRRRAVRSRLDGWFPRDTFRSRRVATPGFDQHDRRGFSFGDAGAFGVCGLDCFRHVLRELLDNCLVNGLAERVNSSRIRACQFMVVAVQRRDRAR